MALAGAAAGARDTPARGGRGAPRRFTNGERGGWSVTLERLASLTERPSSVQPTRSRRPSEVVRDARLRWSSSTSPRSFSSPSVPPPPPTPATTCAHTPRSVSHAADAPSTPATTPPTAAAECAVGCAPAVLPVRAPGRQTLWRRKGAPGSMCSGSPRWGKRPPPLPPSLIGRRCRTCWHFCKTERTQRFPGIKKLSFLKMRCAST
jgi:hypothetical protein